MILRAALAFGLIAIVVHACAAQEADNKAADARPPSAAGAQVLLKQTIDTRGFTEPMKLRKAIEILADKLGGKFSILASVEACRAQFDDPGFDPYDADVVLPEQPSKMSLHLVLQHFANQACKGQGTFLYRQGYFEIVPTGNAAAKWLLKQPIVASFEKRPLDDVLNDLSESTGVAINLDPNASKKSPVVTASFRGNSLEEALVAVTEMSELKFVVLSSSVYVTTASKAEVIAEEEKKRQKQREPAKPKNPNQK